MATLALPWSVAAAAVARVAIARSAAAAEGRDFVLRDRVTDPPAWRIAELECWHAAILDNALTAAPDGAVVAWNGAATRLFGRTDLAAVLADVERSLSAQLVATGGAIVAGPLPTMRGDDGQLRRLVLNLVRNAITFRGDAPPRIALAATPEAEHWCIGVRDNSTGFRAEDATRIFDLFQRLHPRGTYKGTGLGLAICKRIVDQLGGALSATSTPRRRLELSLYPAYKALSV